MDEPLSKSPHLGRASSPSEEGLEGRPTDKLTSLPKPVIGLVGGIGSGKSQVSLAFAVRGAIVITADAIAHEVLRIPEVRAALQGFWGDRVINEKGELDRRKIGGIVFADQAELARLEQIVHPYIGKRILDEIAAAQASPVGTFIVLDAAIMLEKGWNAVCDWIVYVDAPREARLARLKVQRGWTAADLARRESAQLPLSVKASRANAAVDNSGSVESLQAQVDALVDRWVTKGEGWRVGG